MYNKFICTSNHILRNTAFLIVLLCPVFVSYGQQKEHFKPIHSVGLNIGHEHSFNGVDENGHRQVTVLPYWGLDYNFQFARKFAIGLHTDFITESFKVEKNLESGHKEVVERSYPIAPAVIGMYKPTEHWTFGLGLGGEFAKEENYFLSRLSAEYGVEIRNGWEVFGALQYDFRWNAYDTWTIGLGILKAFGKKEKHEN
ncbi:hypothetical protein QTN47_19835 [Danxiaibacter flavus]|uniref:Outer membrane protein beta-barrel domain-containing protein n=1 Tax=Danxiaibacter flavus TaxID=3049108 RepID=A0ABV3ZIS9_9BACT|nr:hypothetical protein QNM32_19845 [Chitinophagaceae bacterium DXS]